jgi:hypothetical protein
MIEKEKEIVAQEGQSYTAVPCIEAWVARAAIRDLPHGQELGRERMA